MKPAAITSRGPTFGWMGLVVVLMALMSCATARPPRQPSKVDDAIGDDAIVLPAATAGEGQRLLIVAYYEQKVRTPNKIIFVNYYDNKARKSVMSSVTTDADGLATVQIPAEPDGGSSTFRMALSESDLSKMAALRTGKKVTLADGTIVGGEETILLKFDGRVIKSVHGRGYLEIPFIPNNWPADGQEVRFLRDVLRFPDSFNVR